MSRRERWRNRVGFDSRVAEPRERFLTGLASLGASLAAPFVGSGGAVDGEPRSVLVLRLDRIGDVVMSLPALADLRAALRNARLSLAVGRWSEEVARGAPVDDVFLWNAPWVGRGDEGAVSARELWSRVRRDTIPGFDLAIDLQGDARSTWLMAAAGARRRVGYANTGSAALLTSVVPLDENLNWVEQNRRAVDVALGRSVERRPFRWIDEAGRGRGARWAEDALGPLGWRRGAAPLIGIHPGAGRRIKEWPVERFRELARRITSELDAYVVVSGSAGEAAIVSAVAEAAGARGIAAAEASLSDFAERLTSFDAFVTGDTSAVHLSAAADVPTVAIFGPSDPARYFSGGPGGFGGSAPHEVIVAEDLACRPCNLIRRPPEECARAHAPECLDLITVARVVDSVRRVLRARP